MTPPPPAPFGISEQLSVAGDGSWRLSLIPEHTPVHLMLPVDDGEKAILVSIHGPGGNHTKSDHARMPAIQGGRLTATASFGPGPLIFVDLDTDGMYYYGTECPVPPAARFRSVEAACATLRRPRPYRRDDGCGAALQQPGDQPGYASSKGLLDSTTMDETTSSTPAQAMTPAGLSILAHLRHDWGMEFYIRVDRGGSFHSYPDLGGPFQSMQQAENAIDQYLRGRQVKKMCMEQAGVSPQEMGIRRCLYWPDGTRKRRTKSYIFQKGHEHTSRLVCAVVDQYNEEHDLYGDLAYELKDLVHHRSFHEKEEWYRHMNFTAKTKGADGLDCLFDKLFFVEIKNIKQKGSDGEWAVNCFCMLEPTDNGHCGGCVNDVKHPKKADAYAGGHLGADELCGVPAAWSDSDEDESSKERRIRRMYEGRKPFVYPAWAVPKET